MKCLERLTDDVGLAEHAWYSIPRRDEGYCTDDNGRALGLACTVGGPRAPDLVRRYLGFLHHAHIGRGFFRLRLGFDRHWTVDPHSDDADGRAIFGIGIAAARAPTADLRMAAMEFFGDIEEWRSSYWRATAHAVLGASAVLGVDESHRGARSLIADAASCLPRAADGEWMWPDRRLGYENAQLPHALLVAGRALGDEGTVTDGLRLLRWLIEAETLHGHFSFAPAAGRGPFDQAPGFDQQPLEAWTMAEAALTASGLCSDPVFTRAIERAVGWFDGLNDLGVSMVDPSTGGCFDGMEEGGVNHNQGAESQLAVLGARSVAHRHARRHTAAAP